MADISRIASPMSICEEDLFDVNKSVERKKKELTKLQNQTVSFVIGSVDVINERISNLNSQLSLYESKLAIESQSSNNNEVLSLNRRKTPFKATRSARARDEADVQAFEGALSLDNVFTNREKSFKKRLFSKKSDEPQLVELQQYPGFDPKVLTPLPHALETGAVLNRVVKAHTDLTKKPNLEIQGKLFKRIAKRYIVLFLSPVIPRYKNVFFKDYGNILAQCIYCAFCLAFPQSWRQFDEQEFKEILLGTCIQWVSGIQPRPGIHEEWNYSALEPRGMRKDESISHDDSDATNIIGAPSLALSGKISSSLSRDSTVKSKSDSKTKLEELEKRIERDKASCAAGKAVEFERCVFNLYGGSPLLSEYFQERDLVPNTGVDHLVKRTQVRSYLPAEAKTYREIISDSSDEVRKISGQFHRLNRELFRDSRTFSSDQKIFENEFAAKSRKILSKPIQVRRLSNIIMMDMKRSKSEIDGKNNGAAVAMQDALAAEQVE